jgi:hypothetical protein
MKPSLMIYLAAAALFSACQDNSKIKTGETVTAEKINEATPEQKCYRYVKDRDTVSLSLLQTDDALKGELSYNLFEKDKSRGKVSGKMSGDTIMLVYNFAAEGTVSVREVAFLKKGNKLIEGFGAVEEKDGSVVFKDHQQLKYNEDGVALTKTDCD